MFLEGFVVYLSFPTTFAFWRRDNCCGFRGFVPNFIFPFGTTAAYDRSRSTYISYCQSPIKRVSVYSFGRYHEVKPLGLTHYRLDNVRRQGLILIYRYLALFNRLGMKLHVKMLEKCLFEFLFTSTHGENKIPRLVTTGTTILTIDANLMNTIYC